MKRLSLLCASSVLVLAGCGGSDDKEEVVNNTPPVIELQSTSSSPENKQTTVSATVSDPDGSVSTMQWSVTDGDAEIISGGQTDTAVIKLPAVESDATVTLQLTATDDAGDSTQQTTTITVNQIEPSVSMQESYTAEEKTDVTITSDVDLDHGSIASYQWTQTSGPEAQLSGTDTDSLQLTLPELDNDATATFELTVTDDDGDTATASTSVEIKRITSSLTINGLATDAPLDNAEITVLLNGEEYMDGIVTDASGNYSFTLEVDESQNNAFVAIKAKGTGDQAAAGLISLLSNVDTLIEDSQGDGLLDVDDNPGTTVSNITTAKYALMKRAAKDKDIFSEQTVEEVSEEVDPQLVLKLATAIKVAIDKATTAKTQLPEGVTDTLALIESEEQTNEYVASVAQTPQFEEAQEEIFEDPALLPTNAHFEDEFVFYTLPASDLQSFSAVLRFNADGTGTDGPANFSWSVDGAILELTYDGEAISQSYTSKNDIYGMYYEQVLQLNVPVSRTYKLVSDNGASQDYLMTYVSELQYPENPDIETEESSFSNLVTIKQETQPIELTAPTKLYLTMPERLTLQNDDIAIDTTAYEQFDLRADGSATALLTNQEVQWSLDEGVLTISGFSDEAIDGSTIKIRKVSERRSGDVLAVEVFDSASNPVYKHDKAGYAMLKTGDFPWTPEIAVGTYGYDTILGESELDAFWFELREDGIAYTVSTYDTDADGVLQEDEVTVYSGTWSINSLGKLEITRFYDREPFGPSSSCFMETSDCLLYNLRTWELLNEDDGKLTLVNIHDFRYDILYADDMNGPKEVFRDVRTLERLDTVPFDISSIELQ